jgi:hypothetical protein
MLRIKFFAQRQLGFNLAVINKQSMPGVFSPAKGGRLCARVLQ